MEDNYNGNEYGDIIPIDMPKNQFDLFIETLEYRINQNYNLKINGKLLHDTEKMNIHFDAFLYDNSEINPFDEEIELSIDFFEDEIPYVQIMSNFHNPTFYDIKNYFLCLSSNENYIFRKSRLDKCQLALEEIFSNIKYFLYHIKECELMKTFIYFGEYNYDHVYHINNFLRNNEKIDFFRINRIKNNKFYDKMLYIICTELYIIAFDPIEENKSLGRILFYTKLSDTEFHFEEIGFSIEKGEPKKRLKVILVDTKNRLFFRESNDEIKSSSKINLIKLNIDKKKYKDKHKDKRNSKDDNIEGDSEETDDFSHYYENKIKKGSFKKKKRNSEILKIETEKIEEIKKPQTTKNIIKIEDYSSKNTFEFSFINFNEDEDNDTLVLQNEYTLFKKFIIRKEIFANIKYNSIITPYRLLFGHSLSQNEKSISIKKMKDEFDRLWGIKEKIYEKYKDSKNEFDQKRKIKSVNNIIFLCLKISGVLSEDDTINNYLDKMRKYALILDENK